MSVSNPAARLEGHPAAQLVLVSLKKAIEQFGPVAGTPEVRSLDNVNTIAVGAQLSEDAIELDRVLHQPGEVLFFTVETRRNAAAEVPVAIDITYVDPIYGGRKRSWLRCFVEQEAETDITQTGETPGDDGQDPTDPTDPPDVPDPNDALTLAGVTLLTIDGESLRYL